MCYDPRDPRLSTPYWYARRKHRYRFLWVYFLFLFLVELSAFLAAPLLIKIPPHRTPPLLPTLLTNLLPHLPFFFLYLALGLALVNLLRAMVRRPLTPDYLFHFAHACLLTVTIHLFHFHYHHPYPF